MTVVSETDLADGGYEQRYALTLAGKPFLRVCRRPVSILPPDGAIVFVDNGARHGAIPRHSAATFKEGKFRHVKFEPTHWSELENG